MDLIYEGKVRTVLLSGNVWQSLYLKYDDFNETTGDVFFLYTYELTKYDFVKITNTYLETFEAGTLEDEIGRTKGRFKNTNNDFMFSYKKEIGPRLKLVSSYNNKYSKSDLSDDNVLKTYVNTLSLDAEYLYSAETSFTAFYEYSKTDYDGVDTEISVHTFTAGLRRFITQQLYIDGQVGIEQTKRSEDGEDFSGTGEYIKLILTNQFKNTNMRLSAEKRQRAALTREGLLDSWKVSASVTRQVLKRLTATLVGFYGHGRYESLDITDKLWGTDVGLKYNFTEKIAGRLKHIHSEKETSDPDGNSRNKRNELSVDLNILF